MNGATMRHYRRIHRLYGIRPFAIPCIVLLALAVLFDQFAGDYGTRAEEAEKAARQLATMRAKVAQQQRFDQIIAEGKPGFPRDAARAFSAADSRAAASAMQAQVQQLLASMNADSVVVAPAGPEVRGEAGLIAVDVAFGGVPQQLVRFPQQLAAQPRLMRLVEAAIVTGPAGAPVPDRIEVKGRVEGWFLRTPADTKPGVGKRADAR